MGKSWPQRQKEYGGQWKEQKSKTVKEGKSAGEESRSKDVEDSESYERRELG